MRTKPLLPLVASIIVGAGLLALMWMYGFTVVPMAQVQQAEQSEAFDPVKYVDGIWASKIIPTITQKAVDLPTILNAMKPDADGYEKREVVP